AERGAVDGGDHRLLGVDDVLDGLMARAAEGFGLPARRDDLEHLDVGAGDPRVRLARDEDRCLDRWVSIDVAEGAGELFGEVRLGGVYRLTLDVVGDHRDAVVARLDRQRRGYGGEAPIVDREDAHAASRTTAAPRPPAAQTVMSACLPPRFLSSRN